MIESTKEVNTTQKPAGVNMRKGAQMSEVTQRIAMCRISDHPKTRITYCHAIRCVGSLKTRI